MILDFSGKCIVENEVARTDEADISLITSIHGDRAPAPMAMSEDIVSQSLVFVGRP